MKNLALLTLGLLLSASAFALTDDDDVHSGILVVEGTYQNRNLYVMNNIHSSGVGFCTYEVRVNGEITTDEWNSSAFEIDLNHLQLKQGAEVFVEIKYKDDCPPKVLNPGVLRPRPSFKTESINIDRDGNLKWSTTGEQGILPFYIQQYKWNKWITVGEVKGNGTEALHEYSHKVDMVSGENQFRVIQKGLDRNVVVSPTTRIMSPKARTTWEYNKGEKQVVFSSETAYEVYDQYGQIKKRGYGESIDVSNLGKDKYYISYDSVTDEFKKK